MASMSCRSNAFLLALLGALLTGPTLHLAAQEPNVQAGGHLAARWCSSCHIIGPAAKQGVSNGAPPFEAIAQMSSTTRMSLRAFLMTPHPPMPDLHLSNQEIDDIASYILSLRHRQVSLGALMQVNASSGRRSFIASR
jgi:mono/diheme cytochrome c family protein